MIASERTHLLRELVMLKIKQFLYVLVLFLFVLAGCISVKPTKESPATLPGVDQTATNPPISKGQTARPTGTSGSPKSTPTSQPSQSTGDWQQFTSASMGISIAYPTNWSATESNSEVTFTSPSGVVIHLDQVQASDLSPQDFLDQNQLPNTRCTSGKTPQGIQYRSCFDTIAFSTSAYLVINSSQGSPKYFTLSTFNRGDLDVFNAMLDSFKAA
jgi:hypothetical protein